LIKEKYNADFFFPNWYSLVKHIRNLTNRDFFVEGVRISRVGVGEL
jgi:hypothetical protein